MIIGRQMCEEISPNMIGLFFEDINYAADGGLYAELIENRSFEAREAFGVPTGLYSVEDCGYAWSAVSDDENGPVMKYVTGTPLSEANPHYLRFTAIKGGQGFANKAYDGIWLHEGDSVNVVFYARTVKYEGGFEVSIRNKDYSRTICSSKIEPKHVVPFQLFSDLTVEPGNIWDMGDRIYSVRNMDKTGTVPSGEWVRYETTLTAEQDIKGGRFVITLDEPGIAEFDFISVIPADAVAGVFRRDLFEALQALNPGFIRFPGGCIVEGISLENRYRWKRTVGNVIDRKVIPNLWAFIDDKDKNPESQRPDSHYSQSYGIGFYEYFLLCELLGAKAVPVLNMGAACQFRSNQKVDADSSELDEYIQDAIDLIEFANGDVNTKWGGLRAQMGHPDSFNLDMLAIGNEQWETESLNLFTRNDRFEQAIHQVYPGFKLLGTAGPSVDLPPCSQAWDYYRAGKAKREDFCYAVDEHYYKSPQWMYENVDLYDNYDRGLYVFAGEYAAHTENRGNNMESALAEAALLTGLEKNAGVVKLASYAPLFNRIGHSQWKPDMIWFDAKNVTLTPNYHVQMLFANNLGSHTLRMDDETIGLRSHGIYTSLSETSEGEIIIKLVNTTDSDVTIPLTDETGAAISTQAKAFVLRAAGEEPEDMPQPSIIIEKYENLDGNITVSAQTMKVSRFMR